MKTQRKTWDAIVRVRKLVLADQVGPDGCVLYSVLGGWMEEAASEAARQYSGAPGVVPLSIDDFRRHMALRFGEEAVLTAVITRVGAASIEVYVRVEREQVELRKSALCAYSDWVFVALDS